VALFRAESHRLRSPHGSGRRPERRSPKRLAHARWYLLTVNRHVALATCGLLYALAGCDKTADVLACDMSAAQGCSYASPCELTWSTVLTDQALCAPNAARFDPNIYDCGGYHVLKETALGPGGTAFYFYDQTSGALVAIVDVGDTQPSCVGGPSTGFARPPGCAGTGNAPAPPQCATDGGSEGGPQD